MYPKLKKTQKTRKKLTHSKDTKTRNKLTHSGDQLQGGCNTTRVFSSLRVYISIYIYKREGKRGTVKTTSTLCKLEGLPTLFLHIYIGYWRWDLTFFCNNLITGHKADTHTIPTHTHSNSLKHQLQDRASLFTRTTNQLYTHRGKLIYVSPA